MKIKTNLIQAYKQAPWRIYTQNSALFMVGVFFAACVIWIMLTVSVQTSEAGLDIQYLTAQQQRLTREIADSRSKIADATSAETMEKKAKELGFHSATMAEVTYVQVAGYAGRQPKISAPPPGQYVPPVFIKTIYTQSLSDWLWQGAASLSESAGVQKP